MTEEIKENKEINRIVDQLSKIPSELKENVLNYVGKIDETIKGKIFIIIYDFDNYNDSDEDEDEDNFYEDFKYEINYNTKEEDIIKKCSDIYDCVYTRLINSPDIQEGNDYKKKILVNTRLEINDKVIKYFHTSIKIKMDLLT